MGLIERECAWCSTSMGQKEMPGRNDNEKTHGICPKCYKEFFLPPVDETLIMQARSYASGMIHIVENMIAEYREDRTKMFINHRDVCRDILQEFVNQSKRKKLTRKQVQAIQEKHGKNLVSRRRKKDHATQV
jgi:hypothetical protein